MMDFPSGQALTHRDFLADEEVTCDVVVMGSGAGGAAAAWVLANAGLRVAILEEGRKWEPEELSTKPSWAYRNLYQERSTRLMMGNIYIPLPGGRAVGGSTLLNSAICFRTPAPVLDQWRERFGVPWADRTALDPLFARIEGEIGVAKTHPSQARGNNLIFKAGADILGVEGDFISRNAPGCIGCGLCQLGCPIGGKGSVDRNLIPTALSKGAALFTSVRAHRLLMREGAAVGIEAKVLDPVSEKPLRRLRVRASKVFLSGGAIGTPIFLLRQGVANSSGQVGKNLRVHSATGMCGKFSQIIDAWDGVTQGYYVPREDSILETFSATPDLYYTQYQAFASPMDQLRHVASCGCMISDDSTGEVKPGGDEGRSSIRYTFNEVDKRKLVRGLRDIARIYFAAGAEEVHPGIHNAGTAKNMKELERLCNDSVPAEKFSIYASHPMGTCRMSAKRSEGVVSPSGESWDVKNLYIADASVFPTALGVNPQVTVMTVAAQIASHAARG
jgi:choline dehydrogenase-like flavoprotein